ncbi:hypothetical protein BGZ63DRAFT_405786 [Mariannaea sp. PMI_226]|nr:hypothetical protein BGZ63DRAFT_405786 [Mariannaea sp. PMI_226]
MTSSPQLPTTIPPSEVRDEITARLASLVDAIESHPSWSISPPPPSNLFHVWDFVKRSHYIMTELDNIENGRPTKHPEQIPRNAGASGANAAVLCFNDVVTRSITINEMIQMPQMLVMLGLSRIDFGDDIRTQSRAVSEAIDKALSSSS